MRDSFEKSVPPLVTIAIPTYNRAASYLPLAVKSALAQSYPRTEVFVSDNASTDETEALMSTTADPRLRYSRQSRNRGANRNYNYCLEQAGGDYFLLLHDDDLIDPDFVASCMEAAKQATHAGLVRTGVRVIDGEGKLLRESRNEAAGLSAAGFFEAWFAGKTCCYLANTLFNTRRLKEAGGFQSPFQLAEDGFAIARLSRYPRVDLPEVKASFRVHGGELTFAAAATRWGEEYLKLLECISDRVPPEAASRVRKEGLRFFAKLTYNRAAAIESPAQRARAYCEIFRMFHYRCLPSHRSKSLRWVKRAAGYARRRAAAVLS